MSVILGIDPGSRVTGWGVIENQNGRLRLLGCGVLDLVEKNKATDMGSRLNRLYTNINTIIF